MQALACTAGHSLNLPVADSPATRKVQRLVNKTDFERLLASRSQSRSAHFALHHVVGSPAVVIWHPKQTVAEKLSTGDAPTLPQPVDDFPQVAERAGSAASGCWLGCVVPKRHAKRAVTRSLLKRQVRGVFERHAGRLPAGMWLVRLRAPFATADFVSARSRLLAVAARAELDSLFGRAAV